MLLPQGRAVEKLEETKAFAAKIGLIKQLNERLAYLDNYACHGDVNRTHCLLYTDFAPYSFALAMQRRTQDGAYEDLWNGGLIYHGPHDGFGSGAAPTYSVSLDGEHGWSIHT